MILFGANICIGIINAKVPGLQLDNWAAAT